MHIRKPLGWDDFAELSFGDAPHVVSPPPGPLSRRLLAQQGEVESNARSYPRRLRIALAEARGATVRDVDGNVYIDCLAGAGALNVGHNNPEVVAAVRGCLDDDQAVITLDLPTALRDDFTRALLDLMPGELRTRGRVQFCGPAGTDAVDAAMKLVKTATGRHGFVAFRGAYHGMGQGPLSLMGATAPKERLGALLADVHFMPYAYCTRCPLKLLPAECGMACANLFGTALDDSHSGMVKPAGVILEAIQGEGGVIVPPAGWLREIAGYAKAAGVPLICDEIQSGLGRTGRWFAFDHEHVEPDVVVLSKSIGGLGLPIAVVVYHERLDSWEPGAHAGTFRGNQLSMAAGLAAIRFMRRHDLPAHAAAVGTRLMTGLHQVAETNLAIREVRGRGLMVGVEMCGSEIAAAVQAGCLARGLIVELGGRGNTVVRFLPPLVLTFAQAERIVDIFAAAVQEASESLRDAAMTAI